SSRIDDEVVQDQRQRDDNDLQDERQDQPKEEEDEITYVREKWVRFEWNYKGRNSLELLQNQASVHDHNEHDYEDLTR
ncbi:hypothetical protein Tco_0959540, partial [Tanacetum coccineum]